MPGYAKLFSDIVDSSIWKEDGDTCKVWITLLALADCTGFVRGSEGWLAHKCGLTVEKTVEALAKFESPDPLSRTPANEGRRIKRVDGGRLILNYTFYRNNLKPEPFEPGEENTPQGWIYYAVSGADIKIAFSKNPWSRLNELRKSLSVVDIVATEKGIERDAVARRTQFERYKKTNGWFSYSKEIQDFVKEISGENRFNNGVATRSYSSTTTASASASASASVLKGVLTGKGEPTPEPVIPNKLSTPEFIALWPQWVEARKKKKACKDWNALFSRQLEWLSNYAPAVAIEIVGASLRNDWQGLFEPKTNGTNKPPPNIRPDRNSKTLNQGRTFEGAAEKSQQKTPPIPGV